MCERTRGKTGDEKRDLAVLCLGLTGESGEVADLVKKHVGHGHVLDVSVVAKELGDVMWYVATIASALGLDLNTVMETNIDKLKKRYPDGFSSEASINRKE